MLSISSSSSDLLELWLYPFPPIICCIFSSRLETYRGLFPSFSFDKTMSVTIAFDLKAMISSLCSNARARGRGCKDWPRFRGTKTTSRLSHAWKVFPKVQKTFILSMHNYFVPESDTPADCSHLGVPAHSLYGCPSWLCIFTNIFLA